MKKIVGSFAKKSLSPTNMSDVKQIQNTTAFTAIVEGGRSVSKSRKKHSSENIKIPLHVMERRNGAAASKMQYSNPRVTNTVDLSKGSTTTSILGHKRKLKGQVAREKISKGVKAPNATGFDLNNIPIYDEGGDKNSSKGVAYESAVGPTIRVKTEPYIEENEAVMDPPPVKDVGSSSHAIMIKLEPFDTETSEIQSYALEENDAGGDVKILEFDLNEVPADEGEE